MICKIRKWKLSDAKDLAMALSNRKIQDNLRDGMPYPYTEQDGIDYISSMISADENETFAFAITVDDKAVGSIGVFRQDNIHRQTAELGYYIAEKYWGKGLMTEAVTQMCEYVFEKSDIIRIYAEPFAYNAASCRVLEKVGFQYEGTLRSNAVKNGKVIDMKMYSLLRTEIQLRVYSVVMAAENCSSLLIIYTWCQHYVLRIDKEKRGIVVLRIRRYESFILRELTTIK